MSATIGWAEYPDGKRVYFLDPRQSYRVPVLTLGEGMEGREYTAGAFDWASERTVYAFGSGQGTLTSRK